MPTENRSSNTEMVSVPRDLIVRASSTELGMTAKKDRMAAKFELRAILAKPAEQPQGEPIQLTAVATLVDDADGGLEASWLLEGDTAELFAGMTLLVAENAPELCQEDGSAQVYTHADPGEVERLRYKADLYDEVWELATGLGYMNVTTAISKLRAQLAERDALLRDIDSWMDREDRTPGDELERRMAIVLSASAEPKPFRTPDCPDCACVQDGKCLCNPSKPSAEPTAPEAIDPRECRKCGSLTADACKAEGCWFEVVQSAPVERDERREFERACRKAATARGRELDPEALRRRADGSHVNPLTECGWWGWQARAALERKP